MILTRVALLCVVTVSTVSTVSTAQCPDGAPPPCRSSATPARGASPNSIAILYFDNLSRDNADEYLADGFTEQLIVRLGRIERLDVRLRSEVQRFHGHPLGDPVAAAGALNVRYLLTGSVRKVGARVVVTAELSQPRGRPSRVWGDVFDRTSTDVLDVETAIAEAVASAVAGTLRPEERAEVVRRPTRDARAYDFYQQADAYWRRFSVVTNDEADLRSAVAFYRAAIERDSAFAAAWVGLAQAWYQLAGPSPMRPALLEVRRAAARAVAFDSSASDAMAFDARALVALTYDWGTAEAQLRRAVKAAPRSAFPWSSLSFMLQSQGRFDEAIDAADSAIARDSVSAIPLWAMVTALIDSRRWALLAGWEPRLRAVGPIIATYAKSYPALQRGHPLEALQAYRALPFLDINAVVEALVAADSLVEARAVVARERAVAEARMQNAGWYSDPDGLAASYALLGDKDEAFRWLERAFAWGNNDLLLRLKVYPPFDSLRDDPRYHDLLRRMHLEP